MTDEEYDKKLQRETDRRDYKASLEGLVCVYLTQLSQREIALLKETGRAASIDSISATALQKARDMLAEIDAVVDEVHPSDDSEPNP